MLRGNARHPLDLTTILKSCHEKNDRSKFPGKQEQPIT